MTNFIDYCNEEIWLQVVGFEGWYEVSNRGRVRRSAPGKGTRVGKVLSPAFEGGGYHFVRLSKYGVQSIKKIHILVAEAYIGARPFEAHINHKDSNKTNNSLSNLEYVSQS